MKEQALPGRLLARRCRQLLRQRTRVVMTGDEQAVHDLRVATRRLEEALEFFAPVLPSGPRKRLGRRARRIRRSLAQVRNVDVLLTLTREAGRRLTADERRGLAPLARRLAVEARTLRSAGQGRAGLGVAGIRRRVLVLQQRLHPSPGFTLRQRSRQILEERIRDVGEAVPAARTGRAAAMHSLRIAIKRYRYALEIIEQSGVRKARRAIEAARVLQTVLGELHDLDVLIDLVRRAKPPLTRSLAAPLRRQRRGCLRKALDAISSFWPHEAARALNGLSGRRAAA